MSVHSENEVVCPLLCELYMSILPSHALHYHNISLIAHGPQDSILWPTTEIIYKSLQLVTWVFVKEECSVCLAGWMSDSVKHCHPVSEWVMVLVGARTHLGQVSDCSEMYSEPSLGCVLLHSSGLCHPLPSSLAHSWSAAQPHHVYCQAPL